MSSSLVHYYSKTEERINVWSHGFGLVLSIIGCIMLCRKAIVIQSTLHLASFLVYGCSLILLYAASTAYHYVQEPKLRRKLNVLDHAAIYILIAGTYVPYTLVGIGGTWGTALCISVAIIGIVGVVLKIFYTGRFTLASTLSYVLMGGLIGIAIKPMIHSMPTESIWCLFVGGIFYIIGAILFSIPKLPMNHATFHIFVLAGSISHFLGVYIYL